MELDHERLDVYHLALDFLVFANDVIEALPRGRSHLADQFTRASTSILLNLAEGAGKLSKHGNGVQCAQHFPSSTERAPRSRIGHGHGHGHATCRKYRDRP